ncbi:MAG: leucine-rich repeat domain-containing protein [Clostridiales bacterium]|nr:leucine-rich repeat domain-containing protein [Clostridiales bacterium]
MEETAEDGEPDAEEEIALTAGESDALVSATADEEDDDVVSSGTCGDNATYTLTSDGVLTISGTGAINDYAFTIVDGSGFTERDSIVTVIIEYGITSIGESAFQGCTSLTSVTIPDSVTSIGYQAFGYCTSLASVTIPDSVNSIGKYVFWACYSLTSVTIGNGVTTISDDAFNDCVSLASVTIPDSVTSIGKTAFASCERLTSIVIPASVTSVGTAAFEYCTSLTDVYYGGSKYDWVNISIGNYNTCSTNATIHYTESGETGGDADPTYYTRYAYASKGSSVTLSAYLLDKNGNEVDFSADSSYTFRWVKVTDAFVVYDEDEGTGLWEQTESDVLGTDSTYTIASVSADDYFDEGSDSLYYYICYIYQDGVLVALDYVNILDPSVWSGSTSNIYANVGDSVTLKAYLENASGFALDFDTFDYDDITFAWVKVTCSMDSASGDWVCKTGDVLGTDASYTIDALTTGDFYNTGSDTYYYYVCYIYQYGYQIASDTVYISGHIWDDGVVTTEPTCTVEGVMTYTCTVCGETKTEAIPATGHSWDDGVVVKAATCTEDGLLTYTCSVCGETETVTIAASGHSYDDGVVTVEPTSTEDGVMTYTCTVCGETYTVAIPATGTSDSGTTDDSSNSSTSDSSSNSSSSSSSSSSSASDAEASGVETGDSASLTLWAALAGIALLAMATILATRRRVSHKK